jgi:hypothetical protein
MSTHGWLCNPPQAWLTCEGRQTRFELGALANRETALKRPLSGQLTIIDRSGLYKLR